MCPTGLWRHPPTPPLPTLVVLAAYPGRQDGGQQNLHRGEARSASPLRVPKQFQRQSKAYVPGGRVGRGGAPRAPEVQGEQVRRSYVIALRGVWGSRPTQGAEVFLAV